MPRGCNCGPNKQRFRKTPHKPSLPSRLHAVTSPGGCSRPRKEEGSVIKAVLAGVAIAVAGAAHAQANLTPEQMIEQLKAPAPVATQPRGRTRNLVIEKSPAAEGAAVEQRAAAQAPR